METVWVVRNHHIGDAFFDVDAAAFLLQRLESGGRVTPPASCPMAAAAGSHCSPSSPVSQVTTLSATQWCCSAAPYTSDIVLFRVRCHLRRMLTQFGLPMLAAERGSETSSGEFIASPWCHPQRQVGGAGCGPSMGARSAQDTQRHGGAAHARVWLRTQGIGEILS